MRTLTSVSRCSLYILPFIWNPIILIPAKKNQMTPRLGRWQTASGPLYYKQTNQRLQQTQPYWISPHASQLPAPTHASLICVWARNHRVIIFALALAGDTGGRHGIETTHSAQKGHRRSQIHSNHFRFLFRLFHSSLIQTLWRLYLTEVTHFQSTHLV